MKPVDSPPSDPAAALQRLFARTGMSQQVTVSARLREEFGLSADLDAPEWFELVWMVSGAIMGRLPSKAWPTADGAGRLVEYYSFPPGAVDPVNRAIVMLETASGNVSVTLPEPAVAAPPTVLLVEDNVELAECARLFLACADFNVVWMKDGWAAWEWLQHRAPAVVVTDVDMPRLDGLELCCRVQNTDHLCGIPILVWSGNPEHEAAARSAGAAAFYSKPIRLQELVARIQELLK